MGRPLEELLARARVFLENKTDITKLNRTQPESSGSDKREQPQNPRNVISDIRNYEITKMRIFLYFPY